MKFRVLLLGILVGLLFAGSLCVEKYGEVSRTNMTTNLTTFKSEEEMKEWVHANYEGFGTYIFYPMPIPVLREPIGLPELGMPIKSIPTPERVSETNVQVRGIDEPDIVKTDGKNIYFSKTRYWVKEGTKIIKAYPPEKLKVEGEIDKTGELLLFNNTLIVLNRDEITGYNVLNKTSQTWSIELNGTLVSARLYNGKLYIVTRDQINYFDPCPIRPLKYNGKVLEIDCNQIYHPTYKIYVDSVYSVVTLNVTSGRVLKATSFVGSSGKTVVYMSKNAIYLAYPRNKDMAEVYYDFMKENRDLFPEEVIERVKKLLSYDISNYAKYIEINVIIGQYESSLSRDERIKFENEFWNRLQEYYEENKRELEKTEIVKLSLDLNVVAEGVVPGNLLNQFSLDEYNGYLRVATTARSTNDLYVLDSKLKVISSIKDYGKDERIYAVRFIMDKGYIVTFKETDPLFVIDLSNPKKPEIKGELKIPGYSSYLHPVDKDTLIGIGKEGSYVKISIFNVSDPEHPVEVDKYLLKEYWSEILKTHHAFLIDEKHKVFFLPASNGGYIFSYKNNELKLLKAVSTKALRAIYINDYLYIVGYDELIVLDENNWEKVAELQL